jgi:O-antigen ligase
MAITQVAVKERSLRPVSYSLPFILVLAYIFVDFGRPQDWIPVLQYLHPGVIVLGGGILAVLIYHPASMPRVGKYLLAFLVVMAMSTLFAYNKHMAFIWTKDLALLLFGAVLPIMFFVDSFPKLKVFFRVWIGIHTLLALYSIRHQGLGVGSFLADENDFSLVINMVIPYVFFMFFVARSRLEKLFLLGSLILFLTANIVTFSRGGFLGLLAVGMFCWFFTPRKVPATIIILLLCGSFLIVSNASYWKEMATIETADQPGDTGYQRLYLWGIGLKLFLDRPILGIGPANFQYTAYNYESEDQTENGVHIWGKVAHSLYITLLSEEGMGGVIVFLMILVSSLKDRKRIRSYFKNPRAFGSLSEDKQEELKTIYYLSLAIDASLVGFLVSGAFITVLYYPHFWLLTAFSAALKNVFDATVRESGPQDLKAGRFSLQPVQSV